MATPLEFPGQPVLPNDRVQGAWFELLAHIMTARSLSDVRANYNQARGYIAALGDMEAIDPMGVKQMSTTALRAFNEALEAQHRDAEGK